MTVAAPRRKSAGARSGDASYAFRARAFAAGFNSLRDLRSDSKESGQIVFNVARGLVPAKTRTIKALARSLRCTPEQVLDDIVDTCRALAGAMKLKLRASA